MSINGNFDRAVFYPMNDMAYAMSKNRVIEVLSNWNDDNVRDINDCIEIRQCKLILENHRHLFSDNSYEDLLLSVRVLFSAACKTASSLMLEFGLIGLYEGIEIQYKDRLWDFLSSAGLSKHVSDEVLLQFLNVYPNELSRILEQKTLLQRFGECITSALEQNPCYTAQLIISSFGSKRYSSSSKQLPNSLTNERIDQIMLSYMMESNVNLNHVQVLASWPRSAMGTYHPSKEVLVVANKKAGELTEALFESEYATTMSFGVNISFSPDQLACKSVRFEDSELVCSYSTRWLMEHADYGTILNNFIYVFEFVDDRGLLVVPAHKHEQGALLEVLGLHPLDEYPASIAFKNRNSQVMVVVFAYRKLLLEVGVRLEEAIEWFFNTYIQEEFSIEGFSISLPTEETSYLDKCKALGPEIERALKAFYLYVRNGEIDSAYFPYMQVKEFESLPSLMERKYLIEGEGFGRFAYPMLSNQSLLAYSDEHQGFEDFFSMVAGGGVAVADFHEVCQPHLEDLQNAGFVSKGEDGFLALSAKTYCLKAIWDNGAMPVFRLSKESEAIADELVNEGILAYSGSLFTPDESDYMNYMFNDAVFSNSLSLRNKYSHASGSIDDPNAIEIEQDYCRMLALLVLVVLKINEELSTKTRKGGVEDFVDWPLVDEDQVRETLIRMRRYAG